MAPSAASPVPPASVLTHGGDGSGVGQEAAGAAGGEAAAVEQAGSEAHHLLEAPLDAPHPAALLKDHLAEEIVLAKGEGGDEEGPEEGGDTVGGDGALGTAGSRGGGSAGGPAVTHPWRRAMRTKPLRFLRMSVVTPGRQDSDSAAPPMTMATALPVPFWDSRYPMARRVTGNSPAAGRDTGAVALQRPATRQGPPRVPSSDGTWRDRGKDGTRAPSAAGRGWGRRGQGAGRGCVGQSGRREQAGCGRATGKAEELSRQGVGKVRAGCEQGKGAAQAGCGQGVGELRGEAAAQAQRKQSNPCPASSREPHPSRASGGSRSRAGQAPLTATHQVLPEQGQAEVSGQRGEVGADAREQLLEARGARDEVAEGADAENAVGVRADDVVVAGGQVVSLHQLRGQKESRERDGGT